MKRMISLLIFIVMILSSLSCTISQSVYVNFVPYKRNFNCQGEIIGIGYSLILNTCVSFDKSISSWLFTWNQETGEILGNKYNGQCLPAYLNKTVNPYRYSNMGCDQGGDVLLDTTRVPIEQYDYKVQISTSPLTYTKVYVKQHRLGGCNKNNLIISTEYSTNATTSKSGNQVYYYYCINKVPTVIDSAWPGGNYNGVTCNKFDTFTNITERKLVNSNKRVQLGTGSGSGTSGSSGFSSSGGSSGGSSGDSTSGTDTGDSSGQTSATSAQTSASPTTAYSTGDSDSTSATSADGQTSTGSGGTSANPTTGNDSTGQSSASNSDSGSGSTGNGGSISSTSSTNSGGSSSDNNQETIYLYTFCSS